MVVLAGVSTSWAATLFVISLMSLPLRGWRGAAQLGYVMPRPTEGGAVRDPALAARLDRNSSTISSSADGGTRSAIMMDVTGPKVAATQFTAYMARANLAILQRNPAGRLLRPSAIEDAVAGRNSRAHEPAAIVPLKRTDGNEVVRRASGARADCGRAMRHLPGLTLSRSTRLLGVRAPSRTLTLVHRRRADAAGRAAMLPCSALTRIAPWIALALLAMAARRFFEAARYRAAARPDAWLARWRSPVWPDMSGTSCCRQVGVKRMADTVNSRPSDGSSARADIVQ
jgi:hypothetical protein